MPYNKLANIWQIMVVVLIRSMMGQGLMRVVRSYVVANEGNTVPRIVELGCALGLAQRVWQLHRPTR